MRSSPTQRTGAGRSGPVGRRSTPRSRHPTARCRSSRSRGRSRSPTGRRTPSPAHRTHPTPGRCRCSSRPPAPGAGPATWRRRRSPSPPQRSAPPTRCSSRDRSPAGMPGRHVQASSLAFCCSNSASLITPWAFRSASLDNSSAVPPPATGGGLLNVGLERLVLGLGVLEVAVGHRMATGDQIDEHAEERHARSRRSPTAPCPSHPCHGCGRCRRSPGTGSRSRRSTRRTTTSTRTPRAGGSRTRTQSSPLIDGAALSGRVGVHCAHCGRRPHHTDRMIGARRSAVCESREVRDDVVHAKSHHGERSEQGSSFGPTDSRSVRKAAATTGETYQRPATPHPTTMRHRGAGGPGGSRSPG